MTSFIRRCVHALAATALFLGMSCTAFSPTWRSVDAGPVPFEDAWEGFEQVAKIDGFAEDPADTDRGMRLFVSKWRTRVLPFGEGRRRRVHAEFEQLAETGHWLIRFAVQLQELDGHEYSSREDPPEDAWGNLGQDSDIEDRFGAKLNLKFNGLPPEQSARPTEGLPH